MKPYLYAMRINILSSLAYKFEVLSGLLVNTIFLLTSVFIWDAVYKTTTQMNGVNKSQMITYSIISSILSTVFYTEVHWRINERIRMGHIALDIVRPVSLPLFWLFEDIGIALSNLFMYLIPLILISLILNFIPLPASFCALLLFIPSSVLSYFIIWLLSAMVAKISFWVLELGNIQIIKDALIRLLAGSFVPLWFFPKSFQKICSFLPFIYAYQSPIGIYIGKYSLKEGFKILFIQLIWIGLLLSIYLFIWNKAKKRILVQGG